MRRPASSEAHQQQQQHQAVPAEQPHIQLQQSSSNKRHQAVSCTTSGHQAAPTRRQAAVHGSAILGGPPPPASPLNRRHQGVPEEQQQPQQNPTTKKCLQAIHGSGTPQSSQIHKRPQAVSARKGESSPNRRQILPGGGGGQQQSISPHRPQAVRRRSSAANASNNNVGAAATTSGTKGPPKVIKSSPSPSLTRRCDSGSIDYLAQHRGSVASSVATFAAVLAAAPATTLRRDSNNEKSLRSRRRPLAVPNGMEASSSQAPQQFLSVPDPSGAAERGACASSPSSSASASPIIPRRSNGVGGWTSQPASPRLLPPHDRPSSLLLSPPALYSTSSYSPLPASHHHDHSDDEHMLQNNLQPRRRHPHNATVRSEPNVCGSGSTNGGKLQPPLMPFLRSLRQLKLFKRRSASELTLVLELFRNTGDMDEGGDGTIFDGHAEDIDGYNTATDDEQLEMDGDTSVLSPRHKSRQNSSNQRFRHHTTSPIPLSGANAEFNRHATVRRTATTLSRRTTQRSQQRRTRRRLPWSHYSPAAIQRRFVHVQEEKAMLQAPTAPIDASKFVAYVQERRKKRILFKGEFLMIQRSVDPQRCTTEVGVRMGERNQYPDTLPYDHNRVVLELRPGVDDSHYINASYVNSWLREKAYVVTQSVRSKQASNELWRTVWELGSNTMVMLTKIFDFMRVMCLQYWPQTHFQFGEIHVETLETRTYAHFVVRTFRLRKTGGPGGMNGPAETANGDGTADQSEEERIVKHFHFVEWELNSFPYISAFVELRRRVRQWMEKCPVDAPIVVHCSNGGGRSGAFLALDANLELLQRTGQLDVYEYGRTLANSRQHLIDTVDQYIFIYDVLCEAVLCNIQPIGMHQLKNRSGMYKARKDRELMEVQDSHENKLLLMLTAPLRIGDCAGGHRLENRGKNRDVMVVPPDHARPYLQTLHGESKDYTYINAVEVDGFTRKSEFIVTEWPKVPTLDSFWTLIFDHNVHTVISLTNQPSETKQYPQFVHNKGKRNYGPFTVEVVNYQQYPGLQSHMVKISKRPNDPVPINSQPNPDKGANKKLTFMISEIMATGASQQQLETEVRLCCIIQVKVWPIENKVPLSTTALIEVLKMTRSWRKRAPDRPEQRPTIVMSHNGISRCGIFIAANVCIDQMEMDHEVDVFHAVKLIRLNRPQLIDMKDEYKYLYDLMLHWYMTSPELRQFEPLEMSNSESDDGQASDGGASMGAATVHGTRSRSGSARRRRGSSRQDGHSLGRSKSTRHVNTAGANAIQRVPTIGAGSCGGTANALTPGSDNSGAQLLARNPSSMSTGTTSGAGSRKRETIYLN